ncbi:unnamed protein product [Closterium sp. NIES-53]
MPCALRCPAFARPACCVAMASLRVLAFDHEGHPIQFDTWLDNLQLYLLSDYRDSISLFDHTFGASPAPPATADSATRSQWLTHEAAARLAICNHLPLAECAHFGQHRTAQALYDAVVARYSSPATAAIGRLLLPYQFPELSAFATVEDLVSHLRTSDARYRAALPAESLDRNPPPMGVPPPPLPLPTPLLLLLTSLVLRMSGVLLLVGSTAAARARVVGVVAVAAGVVVGAAVEVVEVVEVVVVVGVVARVGALVAAVVATVGVEVVAAVGVVAVGLELLTVEVLAVARGSVGARPRRPSNFTCGKPLTQHRCFSRLDVAWRAEFGDEAERPRWAELLRFGVAILDLDYDALLPAMYALSVSVEGDCYLCVPPDPGIEAAALGASESALPGAAPAQALHTFTLVSGASRCFFRDSTTLTPLSAPVPVRLADPSRGPVLARSSTVLPCLVVPTAALKDTMVTATTRGVQRVSICTCTRTGRHLATFTHWPGSSLYTLATEPPQNLMWHHRLGHPSLPRLCGMHSRLLVSGLPRSLPLLLPSPTPPCLPCVEGGQRAAPHSSSFPLTTAPLHTLHMEVPDVLIPSIRTVRLQLRERFHEDLPVLRLHSDRGGEFSSNLLRDFCRGEGILQSFTLPDSPQQNGIAERRIGLVMETGEVGDALVFRVWGSRAFVRDTSADKLSARAIPCVFLSFPPDTPGWQFYHPTSRRVFPSLDIAFEESVPFYRLFPYRFAPPPPPPLFLAPGPPLVAVGSSAARGAASGGAEPEGVEPGGAEPEGVEPVGAESEGAESRGAEPRGTASSGGPASSSPRLSPRPEPLSPQELREWFAQHTCLRSGAAIARDFAAGDTGARGVEATRLGGAGVTAGAGGTGISAAAGPGGARTRGNGAAGTGGVGGAGAGGARAGDPAEPGGAGAGGTSTGGAGAGGVGAGDTGAQVLGLPSSTGLTPRLQCPPPDQSQPLLQPASPLPAPSPKQTGGLTERRELESCPALPVRAIRRRVPRLRPPPVPGTHAITLRPSSVPMRVPPRPPLESSLPAVLDPESDLAHAASPTVSRLLATVVTDPFFESTAASALVAELVDFADACRLDYATALVAESASACPPSVGGECALGMDVLEGRQEDLEGLAAAVPRFASMLFAPEGDPDAPDIPTPCSYAEAITGPYSSQWQAAIDAEMASWKSTGTYIDTVPLSRANIVDGMWIFSGVDYFQTFSPTPKMTTLRVLLHVAAQRDYELHYPDISTAFLQGSLHEEIWLRHPPGFIGSFPVGTQWSLRRPVHGLRQAPREWHDTLRTTLAALGFTLSTADPSLFLRTDTSLPPFYVLVSLGTEHGTPSP